jgi:predicted transcriptional regulator
MSSVREAAERRESLAREERSRSGGTNTSIGGMSGRTAAEINKFRVEESPDGIDLSKMTPQQHAAWAEKIRNEAAARMEQLRKEGEERRRQEAEEARQRREQAEAMRKASEERARQQTQALLMSGVRQELREIFEDATAAEWNRATEAVKAQGLIGTMMSPAAYRLAIAEIRGSK